MPRSVLKRQNRRRPLEGAARKARESVYTLNQLHSYDWLGWNAAFAAMLLATGLELGNRMLPTPLAWAHLTCAEKQLTEARKRARAGISLTRGLVDMVAVV